LEGTLNGKEKWENSRSRKPISEDNGRSRRGCLLAKILKDDLHQVKGEKSHREGARGKKRCKKKYAKKGSSKRYCAPPYLLVKSTSALGRFHQKKGIGDKRKGTGFQSKRGGRKHTGVGGERTKFAGRLPYPYEEKTLEVAL